MDEYERPAIAERVPVGDPLILGVYASPNWRTAADDAADASDR